jgi:hypothetical protein
MAEYGILIDENFAPERDGIYQMFAEYFNNPPMTKIKNENNYSMYMAKAYCMTALSCRYIIAFVHLDDNNIGTELFLSELSWVSFQTRTLENKININSHGYTKELKGPLTAKINKIKVTKEASTYACEEIPIIITLLHTKKNTAETYQQRGDVIHALETWETIITFPE